MAFAQFTYRESLRDIEACLRSMSGKLYHMGFRGKVARSTLADANENRDWRIFAYFCGSSKRSTAAKSCGVGMCSAGFGNPRLNAPDRWKLTVRYVGSVPSQQFTSSIERNTREECR